MLHKTNRFINRKQAPRVYLGGKEGDSLLQHTTPSLWPDKVPEVITCVANLLKAEQTKDAVVQLHLPFMCLVHFVQNLHQFVPSLGWVCALSLVHGQLMERTLPGATNPLVLAPSDPVEGGDGTHLKDEQ